MLLCLGRKKDSAVFQREDGEIHLFIYLDGVLCISGWPQIDNIAKALNF